MNAACTDPILYARLPDGIVIIRVIGKATHQQTNNLLHVFQTTRDQNPPASYIIDMDQCTTMDSTFMGTLASIGLHQRRERGTSVVMTNLSDHVRNLLNTLGLHYILDLRPDKTAEAQKAGEEAFQPSDAPEISHTDRILMMLEAHQRLIDINGGNEIKFESVIKSLRESLAREQKKQ